MKPESISVQAQIPMQFYRIGTGSKKMLLLHGYRHHGRKAILDFEQLIPEGYQLIVPNAPFPIPKSDTSIHRMGYSWYFEDHRTNKTVIPFDSSRRIIANFVRSIGLDAEPFSVMGFSQGAMLAYSLATEFETVEKLVLLSANPSLVTGFLKSETDILAINGNTDEMMNYEQAKARYMELRAAGHPVKFETLNCGHDISSEALKIRDLVTGYLGKVQ